MTRTVLVTGSSRGLGATIAKTLLKQGFNVVVNYHQSKQETEALIKGYEHQAIAIQADVTEREEVDTMVKQATEHFGQIDVVINNALVGFKLILIRKNHLKISIGKTINNKLTVL